MARIVIPGCPHHITQRGNNRQDVSSSMTTASKIETAIGRRIRPAAQSRRKEK